MSFVSSPNRFVIRDANSNVKFDTDEPHPIVYARTQGSITITAQPTATTFTFPTGESSTGTETRYNSAPIISSTNIYKAPPGVALDFCISSIRLTSCNVTGADGSYYYFKLPLNVWHSANGSVVVDQSITQTGKIQRASVATIYTVGNTIQFYFKRNGFNDDVNLLHTYVFDYNVLSCKIKQT
jgi:hypothetical protein